MEEKGRQEGTHLSIAIKQSGMGDRKKGGKKTNPTKQNWKVKLDGLGDHTSEAVVDKDLGIKGKQMTELKGQKWQHYNRGELQMIDIQNFNTVWK